MIELFYFYKELELELELTDVDWVLSMKQAISECRLGSP